MRKIISMIFVLILFASFACSETDIGDDKLFSIFGSDLGSLVGQKVPDPFSSLYGNERVNIFLANETILGHIITNEGFFEDIGAGSAENPTINVYLEDIDVIQDIMSAENPLDRFYELKSEGKIKIDPVGVGSNIKYFFTDIAGRIASWFS